MSARGLVWEMGCSYFGYGTWWFMPESAWFGPLLCIPLGILLGWPKLVQ